MTSGELKARIEELEAVAEHVPPLVLGKRLLAALEEHIGGGFEAINIWSQFDGPEESGEAPLWSEEVHRRTRAALEWAEALAARRLEEIGRLEDVLREERIAREEKPAPESILDPGIPASVADRAAPETEASKPERKVPEDAKIRAFHSSEPEPSEGHTPSGVTKVCKRCGQEKPLSAFGKDVRTADGLGRTCSECKSEASRSAVAVREQKAGRVTKNTEAHKASHGFSSRNPVVTKLRSATPPPQEERLCANGTSCAAVDPDDLVPTPAILDVANPGPLCRRCQRRAGVA